MAFGVMLSLVPQYVIVPASIELLFQFRLWRKVGSEQSSGTNPAWQMVRRLGTAPEIIAALGAIVIYAVHFRFLPPAEYTAFFHRWLPVIVQGYNAYNADWKAFTTFPILIGCLPLFALGAWWSLKRQCSLTLPLLLWCVSSYAAMLIQLKGWYNHYIPMLAGVCLLVPVAIVCRAAAGQTGSTSWRQALKALLVFVVCAAPSIAIRQTLSYPKEEVAAITRNSKPGDKVIVFSPNVPDIYPPLLETGRTNGSRYLWLFPVLMLNYLERPGAAPAAVSQAEQQRQRLSAELKEDLERSGATLVFVPEGRTAKDKSDSMVEFLQHDGLLSEIEERYDKIGYCQGRELYMS
ncbi:MAG: hypothetical protein ACREMY_26510, partial [bacterium]